MFSPTDPRFPSVSKGRHIKARFPRAFLLKGSKNSSTMGSAKAQYAYHLSTLLSISCFAGLFSLTILLLTPTFTCPTHRLTTLLNLSTPLFLSNILLSLLLTTLLHPLTDNDILSGIRRTILRLGLAILYLFLIVGLLLFSLCIVVIQQFTNESNGNGKRAKGVEIAWLGVALLGILGIGVILLGVKGEKSGQEDTVVQGGQLSVKSTRVVPKLSWFRVGVMGVVYVLQIVILIVLLIIGGRLAVMGDGGVSCRRDGVGGVIWTRENPLPVDVVGGNAGCTVVACPEGGGSGSVVVTGSATGGKKTVVKVSTTTQRVIVTASSAG